MGVSIHMTSCPVVLRVDRFADLTEIANFQSVGNDRLTETPYEIGVSDRVLRFFGIHTPLEDSLRCPLPSMPSMASRAFGF